MSRENKNKYAHVVQLRLTREEWRVISQMAWLRRMSVEDLLREGLRLNRVEGDAPTPTPTPVPAPAPERTAPAQLMGSTGNSRTRRLGRRP
jgi:hypothetical protein